MLHHRAVVAVTFGWTTMMACGRSDHRTEPAASRDVAVIAMALIDADFTGKSVRITGTRNPFSAGQYRCQNTVDACLNFTSDGSTDTLVGMCPSENVPAGTWDFSYEVFQGLDCTGGALPNFECLATLDETLPAGVLTTNYVLCSSRPASKTWEFNSVGVDPDCPDGATCIPATDAL